MLENWFTVVAPREEKAATGMGEKLNFLHLHLMIFFLSTHYLLKINEGGGEECRSRSCIILDFLPNSSTFKMHLIWGKLFYLPDMKSGKEEILQTNRIIMKNEEHLSTAKSQPW